MSKIEVNTVDVQCGSTLTLGSSGKTVTLATGASQTGFGRTGTVDWDTTKKTATFTAANGEGYFVDTSGGAVTMNLPSSPSAGNIVAVKDYSGTFQTNNLTIGRGGSPINGSAGADVKIDTQGASIVLVYVDGTQGWVATQDDSSIFSGANFIEATGGTITTVCTDYKVHTFNSSGCFQVTNAGGPSGSNTVDYLVVAGGGGGSDSSGNGNAGGGAGGYRESPGAASGCYTVSPLGASPAVALPVSVSTYPITVGAGGAGGPQTAGGCNGTNSIFSTITSAGGGGAGGNSGQAGKAGGSGGGAGRDSNLCGGAGNTPPVSPAQGKDGGDNAGPGNGGAAGGGGALVAGSAPPTGPGSNPNESGGPGGGGATSSINGTPTARAGGGGAGTYYNNGAPQIGTGGAGGGGGGGGVQTSVAGTAGTANTGGGGGGGGPAGGVGGSGVVIIRYKFQ